MQLYAALDAKPGAAATDYNPNDTAFKEAKKSIEEPLK
jgi:hypothetical protein